jgi:hypothetical protein
VECFWAIRLSYFDSGASFFFALSSILTNIQHTVNKPISFDDLLGYLLPRVGLQSIDRERRRELLVALYLRRSTDIDEEAKTQGYR